jgi:endonuclease G
VLLIVGLLYENKPELFGSLGRPRTEAPASTDGKTDSAPDSKPAKPSGKPAKPSSDTKPSTQTKPSTEAKPSTQTKPSTEAKPSVAFDIKAIRDLDIPAELGDRAEQIIRHSGYTVSYNKHWCISNGVGYELTREETKGTEKRTNKFVVDPQVKGATATDADYRGSGYDRGHLAPAADMTWSQQAMKESFYFSNMTPQAPSLNRGIWKQLEDKARRWAERDSAIYIVCGPLVSEKSKTIGKNRVVVPDGFYKVILSPYGAKPKAIGFLFANEGSLQPLESFAVPVDSVERLTGIDFFYQLPDDLESRIERSYSLSDWF